MTREASLAHAIHAYHDGGLSRAEFLSQIDHLLAGNHVDASRLLDTVSDERIRRLLPADMYAELRGRIEGLPGARAMAAGEETRVLTGADTQGAQDAEDGKTLPPAQGYAAAPAPEQGRIKGVGDTLNGRFVLEECIGFGGMGTVYKALDLRKLEASDRKPYIAIKVLNVQFRGHPKSLIALQREARKAQALAHPNIVTVYDFDRDGATVFLTMELLSGKPLSQIVRKQGFAGMPEADAMRIITGIARALEYAHERGFVHCDLKPGNVFLTDKGEVKVIDFGIARVFRKPEEEAEATVFDPGSLGAMTPAYASPEMQEHLDPDPRDDLYALACISYELLAGRHPFDRVSALQARATHMKPQRPQSMASRPWRAICHALSFDRQARTPGVAQFMEEMRGERRMASPAAWAAGGVLLAALAAFGIGAVLYYQQARHNRPASQIATAPAPALGEVPQTPAPTESSGSSGSSGDSEGAAASAAPPPTPAPTLESMMPMLADMPCSALTATLDGSVVRVMGYVSASYGVPRLKEALAAVPGVKSVTAEVETVGDAECGVVKTLAPYWVKNRQAQHGATIKTKAAKGELREGDPLVVDITTPPFDTHVYVDYFSLDGSVVHMVPSPRATANQAPANYAAAIGGSGNWVVAKPFGNELIVLVTTPAPLFAAMRPEAEPGAVYLQVLARQLEQMSAKYGEQRVAVDFVRIATRAK